MDRGNTIPFAGRCLTFVTVMHCGRVCYLIVANFKLNPMAFREPAPTQSYECINFGDVGFIHHGRFCLLFSAGRPLGGRQRGVDVPLTFEELDVGTTEFSQPREPGYLGTNTIRQIGVKLDASAATTPYVRFVGSSPSHFLSTG